ncbi:MAG: hypothetical protein KBF74_08350, partial [Ferruginibacter sp.]|nr:hypothetical protein [Ferruginibacter sp.]
MQIIKSLIKLFVFVCPVSAVAQSTYLTQGSKEYHFIDRLEIKQQKNTDLNFSGLKPYNRRAIVMQAQLIDSARSAKLTKVDEYNLRSLYMNNSEWVANPGDDAKSRRPILKTFYKTKPNLLEVNTKDFFLVVNPVLQFQYGNESDNNETQYLNSRGVSIRGRIANKIGFSSTIIENQERGPSYFQDRVNSVKAVPGVGFYKPFKTTGYDYFDARGYITFNAT